MKKLSGPESCWRAPGCTEQSGAMTEAQQLGCSFLLEDERQQQYTCTFMRKHLHAQRTEMVGVQLTVKPDH